MSSVIQHSSRPLRTAEDKPDFSPILEAIGDAKVVMIGEASHGTHEFYWQRAELTKELIEKKGFSYIAVEADWPDAYRVNRYVQWGKNSKDKTAEEALGDFKRFPLWMWRNEVVRDFVEWLRKYNEKKTAEHRVAFYGMDLYSMFSSMDAVVEYLEKVSPDDAEKAKQSYSNFERFQGEPQVYGYAAGLGLSSSFEKEVVRTLVDLRQKGEAYLKGVGGLIDGDELFYAEQNAALVKDAEQYYRKMYHADENTWNIRDQHMADTLWSLYQFQNKKFKDKAQKFVVWAHNSHLGDARETDAGQIRGEHNVGQLLRQKFGMDNSFIVGHSTFTGTVTAAKKWDSPALLMQVKPGLPESWESLFHGVTERWHREFLLITRSNSASLSPDAKAVDILSHKKLERYIGVIYAPQTERASHYSRSRIGKEYDAVIFNDVTSGVRPIDPTPPWEESAKKLGVSAP